MPVLSNSGAASVDQFSSRSFRRPVAPFLTKMAGARELNESPIEQLGPAPAMTGIEHSSEELTHEVAKLRCPRQGVSTRPAKLTYFSLAAGSARLRNRLLSSSNSSCKRYLQDSQCSSRSPAPRWYLLPFNCRQMPTHRAPHPWSKRSMAPKRSILGAQSELVNGN